MFAIIDYQLEINRNYKLYINQQVEKLFTLTIEAEASHSKVFEDFKTKLTTKEKFATAEYIVEKLMPILVNKYLVRTDRKALVDLYSEINKIVHNSLKLPEVFAIACTIV